MINSEQIDNPSIPLVSVDANVQESSIPNHDENNHDLKPGNCPGANAVLNGEEISIQPCEIKSTTEPALVKSSSTKKSESGTKARKMSKTASVTAPVVGVNHHAGNQSEKQRSFAAAASQSSSSSGMPNFRYNYLQRLNVKGIEALEAKKSVESIFNDGAPFVDRQKLALIGIKFDFPAQYRVCAWEVLLGIVSCCKEISSQIWEERVEQCELLARGLRTMRKIPQQGCPDRLFNSARGTICPSTRNQSSADDESSPDPKQRNSLPHNAIRKSAPVGGRFPLPNLNPGVQQPNGQTGIDTSLDSPSFPISPTPEAFVPAGSVSAFLQMYLLEDGLLPFDQSQLTTGSGRRFFEVCRVMCLLTDDPYRQYWLSRMFTKHISVLALSYRPSLKQRFWTLVSQREPGLFKHISSLNTVTSQLPIDEWIVTGLAGLLPIIALPKMWDKIICGNCQVIPFVLFHLLSIIKKHLLRLDSLTKMIDSVSKISEQTGVVAVKLGLQDWKECGNPA